MKGFPFPASSEVKCGTVSQAWEPAYADASLKTEQVVFRNLRSPLCLVIREQGQDSALDWEPLDLDFSFESGGSYEKFGAEKGVIRFCP